MIESIRTLSHPADCDERISCWLDVFARFVGCARLKLRFLARPDPRCTEARERFRMDRALEFGITPIATAVR